tara:strand:- start:966 stop:1430 length:465 start_codon:yes stop_codon:yes gene_type:complete
MSDSLELLGDPEEPISQDPTTHSTYTTAGPREWNGVRLHGWSGRRRAATYEIGFQMSGSYLDPVRVLYASVADDVAITRIFQNPAAGTEMFIQWAEKEKLMGPDQPNWQAAFDIAQEIIVEVEKAEFESGEDAPVTNEMGNATGHHGSLPTNEA